MEWLQSLVKTDNIALGVCFIIIYFGYKEIAANRVQIEALRVKIEKHESEKVDLTGRIKYLEGQNSLVETLANQNVVLTNQTVMMQKMDEKINLLHAKRLNK